MIGSNTQAYYWYYSHVIKRLLLLDISYELGMFYFYSYKLHVILYTSFVIITRVRKHEVPAVKICDVAFTVRFGIVRRRKPSLRLGSLNYSPVVSPS